MPLSRSIACLLIKAYPIVADSAFSCKGLVCPRRAATPRKRACSLRSIVESTFESVVAISLELLRHLRGRREDIKPMKRPGINVKLGRHARLNEALRVL